MSLKKVLLVDDQEDLIEVLSLLLKKAHYHIKTALSGHQAMKEFDEFHPDLVITDIRMPDGDGVELMNYISSVSEDHFPPVLVFSGYAGPDEGQLEQNPNFAGFLRKPVSWPVLIDAIKKIESKLPPHSASQA